MDAEHGKPGKGRNGVGKEGPQAIVLDAGALVAFERADAKMRALLRDALKSGVRLVVPAAVVGQVWRDGARQFPLRALLRGPTTVVPALDHLLAEACGVLCGRAGTSDVVDASVVLPQRGGSVQRSCPVTSMICGGSTRGCGLSGYEVTGSDLEGRARRSGTARRRRSRRPLRKRELCGAHVALCARARCRQRRSRTEA